MRAVTSLLSQIHEQRRLAHITLTVLDGPRSAPPSGSWGNCPHFSHPTLHFVSRSFNGATSKSLPACMSATFIEEWLI